MQTMDVAVADKHSDRDAKNTDDQSCVTLRYVFPGTYSRNVPNYYGIPGKCAAPRRVAL